MYYIPWIEQEFPTDEGTSADEWNPPDNGNYLNGRTTHSLSLHSASIGRSHGIQTGIGFSDKHGAGNSTALHVPGIQTDALPKLIQGSTQNSVFRMVGQIGISNGIEMDPTDSGGIGRSGIHARGGQSPVSEYAGAPINTSTLIIIMTASRILMTNPGIDNVKINQKFDAAIVSLAEFSCQGINPGTVL